MKADMMLSCDEEERLSIISSKGNKMTQPIDIIISNHSAMISRHPSCNNRSSHLVDRNSVGNDSSMQRAGSFYGKRDFENKHDDTADIGVGSVNNNKLCRKPSTLDNVLTRIKSMRNSDMSDESDNDDDVYYDDDDYNDDHEDS